MPPSVQKICCGFVRLARAKSTAGQRSRPLIYTSAARQYYPLSCKNQSTQRFLCCDDKKTSSNVSLGIKPQSSSAHYKSYKTSAVQRDLGITDLKPDAEEIFRSAIRAVYPKAMINNVLKYDDATSTLQVQDKTYKLNRNVFVVGMGKAVPGMARVVEDIIGRHLVAGIISIPEGMKGLNAAASDGSLNKTSKIEVYEGSHINEASEVSYNAAKAIHSLITKLTEKDLLIVLCTGGGSTLCPYPYAPITLDELRQTTHLLLQNGAPIAEVNTVRKNIEVLKGGGLAMAAKPSKVISLILSSFLGDPMEMIASGPTCPAQPTPRHCIEIFNRLMIWDQVPESVRKFLEREATVWAQQQKVLDNIQAKEEFDSTLSGIQNIVVGNNSIGCEAAAGRASELGYLPVVVTTKLDGESRQIGHVHAKLAKYIMMVYDRKLSMEPNTELAKLELDLVGGGMHKAWLNQICNAVDAAHNLNKDLCLISGGELFVNVRGTGVGGKNMEAALSAAIHMQELFREEEIPVAETRMCFLSCDSDGLDGLTQMAGAMVDQDFLDKVKQSGLEMRDYLANNDSFGLMKQIDNGSFMVKTNVTGTNIMDLVVLLVQMPRERE